MVRKIGLGLGGLIVLLALLILVTWIATMPEGLEADSESGKWLQEGPFSVASTNIEFVDETRPTAENNGVAGSAQRKLPTTLWYPKNSEGSHPLIIHSHGFVSNRSDMAYVARHLASYGYIVVAADYPLTSGATEGGPNARDVVNQPADISFLIDSVMALSGDNKPFTGEIDPAKIGVTGYSLGGLTVALATYHSQWRDPRIKAAISIAGLSAPLQKRFYASTDVPFLMIAGTLDALVNFESHASVIPQRVQNSAVVAIAGGTHLGFAGMSEPLLRLMDHPDSLGCSAVLANLEEGPEQTYQDIGGRADGVVLDPSVPDICDPMPTETAIHPGRQQMITKIAVLAFFEYVFSDDPGRQAEAQEELARYLGFDVAEAGYSE